MSKIDDFDDFLAKEFRETRKETEDNGFTERVLAGLPAKKRFVPGRNIIIYPISIVSVIIFLVSGGMRLLTVALANLFSNGIHLTLPTFTTVFVILAFISIPFFIATMEHEGSTV
jgi:hypothetical protein